jgi:hypothetical protein
MKYGTIAESFVNHHNINSHICLWMDPSLLPVDPMRIRCSERSSFMIEQLRSNNKMTITDLVQESLNMHRRSIESDGVKSVRQFLILSCLADEEELDRNFYWMQFVRQIIPL